MLGVVLPEVSVAHTSDDVLADVVSRMLESLERAQRSYRDGSLEASFSDDELRRLNALDFAHLEFRLLSLSDGHICLVCR